MTLEKEVKIDEKEFIRTILEAENVIWSQIKELKQEIESYRCALNEATLYKGLGYRVTYYRKGAELRYNIEDNKIGFKK